MSTTRVSSEENPSQASAAPEPPAPQGRKLWLVGLAAVALLGGGVLLFSEKEEEAPAVRPDVPRVEGDRILFSAGFAERIGYEVAKVRKGTLTPVVSVVGNVTLDPEHVAAAGTRLKGMVRAVHKYEGDTVEAGEILAEIDSAELGEAQASITMIRAERQAAATNAARERQLFEQQLTTARESEVAEAELKRYDALLNAAQQRVQALGGKGVSSVLGRYVLRAPMAGTIIDRNISTGQSVQADLVAFRIGNLDHLWVELAVYEQHIGSIAIGDSVAIQLLSTPDVKLEGHVELIGAQVNPETRRADVRVEVDNRERLLLPGQAVTAEILASRGSSAVVLSVPKSAVIVVDGRPIVFVSTGTTEVRVAEVELGKSDGGEQQILNGLAETDEVVVGGVFALKSELFR